MTDERLKADLFGLKGRLFTLPAGADFIGELACTLIEATNARSVPENLADALIFVPNRRSARALAARLFQELGRPGFLPPDIRPLGDAGDNDPALLGELADVDIRPPMPAGGRLGALAKLVMHWHEVRGKHLTLASAVAVARDLGRLLDQAALAGSVEWGQLSSQVEDKDLAQHWQVSVEFLAIISDLWPALLDENGYSDTHDQDRLLAEALCARWERTPPTSPVIIAGSTGTSPATRLLMQAALDLPQGAVLFPGLDHDTDDDTWHAIGTAPSHPQFAFHETLNALGVTPRHVRLWPGYTPNPARSARRALIEEALAPAETTADWVTRLQLRAAPNDPASLIANGLTGLSLVETETEAEEADVIALLLRETIETDGQTAALVTPDAGLARRVSALLETWGLHVSPSSGRPLSQTPAGDFLTAALDWAMAPGSPVALARILKTERIVFLQDAIPQDAISALERGVLRGLRRWKTLEELGDTASRYADYADLHPTRAVISGENYTLAIHLVEDLLDRFGDILKRFDALLESPFSLRTFAELLAELVDTLSKSKDDTGPSMFWSGADGAEAARFLEDLAFMGDWMPDVAKEDIAPLVSQLASERSVSDDLPSHPRLHIWGPLEARLQTCDRLILSGLNEGTWPEQPGTDGFIPRHIRAAIGLPDTEARIGLSAHDFAQLACTPNVVLTRSLRVNDKPAVASRWLWRLRILASGALKNLEAADDLLMADSAHLLDWARALQNTKSADPVHPPKPLPPSEARSRYISVTDVENLIRDPYAFYAGSILKLSPLEALDAPLNPQSIGTAIHAALEGFDTLNRPYTRPDEIIASFAEQLREVGADDLFILEREPGWEDVAKGYLDWMVQRDGVVKSRKFEVRYNHTIALSDYDVEIIGRADLVETLANGSLAITDFKTGKPPSNRQVLSGLSPQLPLLGAMAALSAEEDKPTGPPADFFYVGFGSGGGVQQVQDGRKPVDAQELAGAALAGLKDLLTSFAKEDTPYLSGPRIQFQRGWSDYDQLSRRQEWADPGHTGAEDYS